MLSKPSWYLSDTTSRITTNTSTHTATIFIININFKINIINNYDKNTVKITTATNIKTATAYMPTILADIADLNDQSFSIVHFLANTFWDNTINNYDKNTVKIATATNIATAHTPTILTDIWADLNDRSFSIVHF